MNRFERTLLKRIDALTKRSIKLQREISRAKKTRLCMENIMLWIKLITVVGSLLLVLWSISTSFFNIR
jgi:cell division septal protein FtsQ